MDYTEEFLDGYRYFGTWSSKAKVGMQYKVYSHEDVIEKIQENDSLYNCGLSISTFVHGMPKLLYMPFDFDSTNLEKSFDDAYKLFTFFKDSGYSCMLNFSGKKGFHVLVKTVPKTYGKNQLKSIQVFMKRFLGLETCDEQVFKDIRRLIRIPGTLHMGSGNMCNNLLVHDGDKLFDISEYAPPLENEYTPDDFKRYDSTNGRIYHPYPCVEERIFDKEPRQIIRFAWVIEQLKDNKTEEEMLEIPREFWVDYNPDYTLYQIRHIAEGNYVHPSCDTLQDMGFCLGEECPYYHKWDPTNVTPKLECRQCNKKKEYSEFRIINKLTKSICKECVRENYRLKYKQLKEANKCVYCEKDCDRFGPICTDCLKKFRKHTARYRKKLKEQNLCIRCGKPAAFGHVNCNDCLAYMRHNKRIRDNGGFDPEIEEEEFKLLIKEMEKQHEK